MTELECPKCHNTDADRFATVVESKGYIYRSYDEYRAYGGGHGSATLIGWRCMNCGTEQKR
jgi:hypothetical protein